MIQTDRWLTSRQAAVASALLVMMLLLISDPVAEFGILDDWSYAMTVFKLADTGHIVYNGWATAMLGWQLYLGAAAVKLAGHSFTVLRCVTLLVAGLNTFLLHRCLIRAGVDGRKAVFGTLTISLTPIVLILSASFMSDIYGLFAITCCLYGCLRTLTATTDRARIGWLLMAVTTNLVCGTSRQIAWFGVIFLVPATVFLLRRNRSVLTVGIVSLAASAVTILGLMHWFNRQLYAVPEPLLPKHFAVGHIVKELSSFLLDIPFLLLPLAVYFAYVLFIRDRRRAAVPFLLALLYTMVAVFMQIKGHDHFLEPTSLDSEYMRGVIEQTSVFGSFPKVLPLWMRAPLTLLAADGVLSALFLLWPPAPRKEAQTPPSGVPWRSLLWLTLPYIAGYILMLTPRANGFLFHRYAIGLFPVLVLLGLGTLEHLQVRTIPRAAWGLLALSAVWAVAVMHDQFSLLRARVALRDSVLRTGLPREQLNDGWEDDLFYELSKAPAVNEPRIVNPPGFYKPVKTNKRICPFIEITCDLADETRAPHMHPVYGIALFPISNVEAAPFPHQTYSRWLSRNPGVLYVIRLPQGEPSSTPDAPGE